MFINIYLSAYSVDKAIMRNVPDPWWGGAAVAAAAMLPEDTLVMQDIAGHSPLSPREQGQSVGSSSREKVGYWGCWQCF